MKNSYLRVTYRNGRALAAYYYFPRQEGDKAIKTKRFQEEFLVDYTEDGRVIGIEIPSPSLFNLSHLNDLLKQLGSEPAGQEDFAPLLKA